MTGSRVKREKEQMLMLFIGRDETLQVVKDIFLLLNTD